jgi:hypothetical protein
MINNKTVNLILLLLFKSQPDTDLNLHDVITACLVNILILFPFNSRVAVRNHFEFIFIF